MEDVEMVDALGVEGGSDVAEEQGAMIGGNGKNDVPMQDADEVGDDNVDAKLLAGAAAARQAAPAVADAVPFSPAGRAFEKLTTPEDLAAFVKAPDFASKLKNIKPDEYEAFWGEMHVLLQSFTEPMPEEANKKKSVVLTISNAIAVFHTFTTQLELGKSPSTGNRKQIATAYMHVANVLQPVLLDDHPADAKVKKLLAAVYELLIQLNMQSARILYVLLYLVEQATRGKGTNKDVERLYKFRLLLRDFEYDDASMLHLKTRLFHCFTTTAFNKIPQGQKFLEFLLTLHQTVPNEIRNVLMNWLPVQPESSVRRFGLILYNAWERVSVRDDPDLKPDAKTVGAEIVAENLGKWQGVRSAVRVEMENVVQKWMEIAVLANPKAASKALHLLAEFHTHRTKRRDVMALLTRLYGPILWRNLSATNHRVRVNATGVLLKTFPLTTLLHETKNASAQEKAEEIHRQIELMKTLLVDPHEDVRECAVLCVTQALSYFWSILDYEDVESLFKLLCEKSARDKRNPKVRANVARGLTYMLSENPNTREQVKIVGCTVSDMINDKSPLVRSAFCDFLERVLSEPELQVQDIVRVEKLLTRVAYEYAQSSSSETLLDLETKRAAHRVGVRLAAILAPSMVKEPLPEDLTEEQRKNPIGTWVHQVNRLIDRVPLPVLEFVPWRHIPRLNMTKLVIGMLYQAIHGRPKELNQYRIAAIGILLRKAATLDIGGEVGADWAKWKINAWFTETNVHLLLTARPDLTMYIIDAISCLPCPGSDVKKIFIRNLKAHPQMIKAASGWELVPKFVSMMEKDFVGVASTCVGGPAVDAAYKELDPGNLRLYNLLLKNSLCRERVKEKRESLLQSAHRLTNAFVSQLAAKKNAFPEGRAKEVEQMLSFAFRVSIRCNWLNNTLDVSSSPVPKVADALVAWFFTSRAPAAEKLDPPKELNEDVNEMLIVLRTVIENLAILHHFKQSDEVGGTTQQQLQKAAVLLCDAMWYVASEIAPQSVEMADTGVNHAAAETWRFLVRVKLKMFRPTALEATTALGGLLAKVSDDVGTDEELRTLWASVLMRFQFAPVITEWLRKQADKDENELNDLDAQGRLTQAGVEENPLGEKRFLFHQRVADALYAVAPRYKGVHKTVYFERPDGTCGPAPKSEAAAAAATKKVEIVDEELDEIFKEPDAADMEDALQEDGMGSVPILPGGPLAKAPSSSMPEEAEGMDVVVDESGPRGAGMELLEELADFEAAGDTDVEVDTDVEMLPADERVEDAPPMAATAPATATVQGKVDTEVGRGGSSSSSAASSSSKNSNGGSKSSASGRREAKIKAGGAAAAAGGQEEDEKLSNVSGGAAQGSKKSQAGGKKKTPKAKASMKKAGGAAKNK